MVEISDPVTGVEDDFFVVGPGLYEALHESDKEHFRDVVETKLKELDERRKFKDQIQDMLRKLNDEEWLPE